MRLNVKKETEDKSVQNIERDPKYLFSYCMRLKSNLVVIKRNGEEEKVSDNIKIAKAPRTHYDSVLSYPWPRCQVGQPKRFKLFHKYGL